MPRELDKRSDFELLDAWRYGDNQAGNQLFDRYFDRLFQFFSNKIGDGADDLVQETFIACVKGRDRFEGRSSFRTYLFAVARKLLYREYQRRQKTRDKLDFDATSARDLGASPTALIAKRDEQRLLLEALTRISLENQIALEMFYWEGMRGREIATVLGIGEPAVRGRIRRGLEQLEKAMAEIAESNEILESTVSDLEGWAESLRKAFRDRRRRSASSENLRP